MFFKPKKWEHNDKKITVARAERVEGYAGEILRSVLERFGAESGAVIAAEKADMAPESYEITLTPERVTLKHGDERGLIYAAVTLLQLFEFGEAFEGVLYDAPDCEFRGHRAYLPGRRSFKAYREVVDKLVYYKYNYLSLEIGGAMEYKKHPEVNAAWKKFCDDVNRYSGRASEIQSGFHWPKDSIHNDNADGDILTQDEVRELIKYAQYRGLIVYPEAPTLSHTDYICLAHPEIAERADDPYPDTYCPSNPKSYEITFDILDEIADVFDPPLINIGHDEFYSFCVCEKCRKRKPAEVFTYDVTRIRDHLAERGIRTAMWCDKLFPVVTREGKTYGGTEKEVVYPDGTVYYRGATFECQQTLPRDVLMINWYYSFGMQYDCLLRYHGYESVYGNLSPAHCEDWRLRRQLGVKGGSCSNWGKYDFEYMQRNNQYTNIVKCAYALWSGDYDSDQKQELARLTREECYRMKNGDTHRHGMIELEHNTSRLMKYTPFWCGLFIEDEKYHLGKYVLTYEDGDTAEFEVKYGLNISNDSLMSAGGREMDPSIGVSETAAGETICSALPFEENGVTWYRTAFENPHPDKKVRSFEYVADAEDKVVTRNVKFY